MIESYICCICGAEESPYDVVEIGWMPAAWNLQAEREDGPFCTACVTAHLRPNPEQTGGELWDDPEIVPGHEHLVHRKED